MEEKLRANLEVRAVSEGRYVDETELNNKRQAHSSGSVSHGGMVTVNRATFCNGGRLGNKIFMLASAFGIAERSNATLVLEEGNKVEHIVPHILSTTWWRAGWAHMLHV